MDVITLKSYIMNYTVCMVDLQSALNGKMKWNLSK